MPKVPITVVILTLNEELNLNQAISNVVNWSKDVFVLDSGSTDATCELAKSLGAKVFHRPFDNYAAQRNYAIKELPITTTWMLFLDADEYLTEELKKEIQSVLDSGTSADGFLLKRRFYFMGKWIKYGGYYPTWILRMFKVTKASCEREVNEHISIDGTIEKLRYDFADNNKKSFADWLEKHNRYSSYEATLFDVDSTVAYNFWGDQVERKQWFRQRIWNRLMPPLIRPFIYFIYRYFFRFGFLDGKIGFIYHFMQGLVLHFIIDIKYLELKMKSKTNSND